MQCDNCGIPFRHEAVLGDHTFFCSGACANAYYQEESSTPLPIPAIPPPPMIPLIFTAARYTGTPDTNVLPEDADARKASPIFSGVLNYFPLAIAAVARVSKRGNNQHNPGESLGWARGKSMDHEDCVVRHLIDVETVDPETGEYRHAEALAWRALAKLQELEEKRLGKPMSRGSRLA